jgi:hypothetical protein
MPVYAQGDPGAGIGGYDLRSAADRAFAFDYDHSGRLDYLALYRPGTGTIWILRNSGGPFMPVYAQADPGAGIGGYDLRSAADRAFRSTTATAANSITWRLTDQAQGPSGFLGKHRVSQLY